EGFIPEKVVGPQPSDFDLECAKKLYDADVKNGRYASKGNRKDWAYYFRLLRTEDGADRDDRDEILEWYIQEADWNGECPVEIYSGRAFREKFGKLQSWMLRTNRERSRAVQDDPPPQEIKSVKIRSEKIDNMTHEEW